MIGLPTGITLDLDAVSLLVRWLLGWVLLPTVPGLPRTALRAPAGGASDPSAPSEVSVVIPARNEEDALAILLPALTAQNHRAMEVIVVDDHSTDRTAKVAADHGATVVSAAPLPPGWTGKTWAVNQGAHLARGDVLVLLDADTRPAPDLLTRLLSARQRHGGLVTVQPYHLMVRPVERLAAMFNLIGVMGARLGRRTGTAFGPVMATRKADYEATGGHALVRSAIVEDIALGREYRRRGLPVHSFGGRDAVAFRMYPHGLGQLVEGFTKNIAAGALGIPWWTLLLIVGWLSGAMVAAWELPAALVGWALGGDPPALGICVLYALYAIQLTVMLRQLGNFGPTALLFPLAMAGFLLIFIRSLLGSLRGEVTWKGRTVVTGTRNRSPR